MDKQLDRLNSWEAGLVAVAQRQLQYLRELDEDRSGEISSFDLSSALSGLCALTDLIHEECFDFPSTGPNELMGLNEAAMGLMRNRALRPRDEEEELPSPDHEAAVALYDAILSNLPRLATGDTSGHALALSKAMYQNLVDRCGDRPGFDAASSVIQVQDYRAMQLAGRSPTKL